MLEIRHEKKSVQAAYSDIFDYETIVQTDSLYLWLLDLLRPEPNSSLVDVACGQSQMVALAQQRGLTAYGLDYAPSALNRANQRGGEYVACDAEQIPFVDNSVDYFTSVGSLEHYHNMALGVREMARILKPAGRGLLFLPNTFSLLHNVYIAMKTGQAMDDGQPLQRYGTRQQWVDLLTENGLIIEKTHKYNREWPRNWTDVKFYLSRPKKMVYLSLAPFVPLNLCCCFVFICRKK